MMGLMKVEISLLLQWKFMIKTSMFFWDVENISNVFPVLGETRGSVKHLLTKNHTIFRPGKVHVLTFNYECFIRYQKIWNSFKI